MGVAGASGATRGHGAEVAQAAAHHIDVGDHKVGAGFAEREGEGLRAGERAAGGTRHHDRGWCAVAPVVAVVGDEVDSVVGIRAVGVGVARRVAEGAAGHVDAARALPARCRGEGGAVGAGVELGPARQCAAADLHVCGQEVAGGLRQHKGDAGRLARSERGFVGGDGNGGCRGVGRGRVGAGVVVQ